MRYARSAWPRPLRSMLNSFLRIRWKTNSEELYGPPDGYLAGDGALQPRPPNATDKAVYEIEIKPEDGLYPLPYMARQKGRIGVGGRFHQTRLEHRAAALLS